MNLSQTDSPWPSASLDSVADIESGVTKGRKLVGKYVSVPYLRVANVQAGHLALDEIKNIDVSPEELERYRLIDGDILMTEGGDPDKLGRGTIWDGSIKDCIHQNHIFRVRLDRTRVEPRYFSRLLTSRLVRTYFLRAAKQTTGIASINKTQLRALPVPLPPLPEQRRIAAILDKAAAIRRKRREAIGLTEELLRAAFLEMFGDPVANPKGWTWRLMGDVIERLEAGWSANGEARTHTHGEYGVLKISAVTSGVFRPHEHKAVDAAAIDRPLVTPCRGDLLFSRANTRELVAATCLVEDDYPTLFLPDKLWKITPRTSLVTAPFLRFILSHERIRSDLTKTATGTSGSMLNISMDKLRSLRIPTPLIHIQEKFDGVFWHLMQVKGSQQAAAMAADNIFSSLLHRAFRGELTASEPAAPASSEPATGEPAASAGQTGFDWAGEPAGGKAKGKTKAR